MLIPKLQNKTPIVEIDIPWAIAYIEEKFDDVLTMLESDCIIYGGAVRDIIAELPFKGDLDIAIPYNTYNKIITMFDNSPRWIVKNSSLQQFKNNKYKTVMKPILDKVITYINLSGEEVQLIQTVIGKYNTEKYDKNILNIVYNVDMVCSGVIMDIEGNIKEILPGAIKDCKNRELNINPKCNIKQINYKILKNRVTKLVERGWKNNINLEQYKENN